MSEPSKAVFLSYASQDAEAARRICDALRAAGIEVWFDQSELRGGDAWDHQIRQQIHDCALFIPLISSNTQARPEGYFRLEWKLAVERTHLMSDRIAFLVPVVIDGTSDAEADVPDAFRAVQWTHFRGGETLLPFCQRVAALLAGTQKPSPGAMTHPSASSQRRQGSRWITVAAAVAIVVAVIALKPWQLGTPKPAAVPAATLGVANTTAAAPEKSIAVLPFADMSEKRDQEYFADGMAEEILNLLARIPQLTVIGRTSSFRFKGRSEDLRAIAVQLGVAYVVEGSVRRSGARIRVTAQLIDARSGAHRWSETYDRDFGDVLALQDEVATNIARALQLRVDAGDPRPMRRLRNAEAYNLYLRGRLANDRTDEVGFREAQSDFERALALDPRFLEAAEALAWVHVWQYAFQMVPGRIAAPRALEAADLALRIDANSASAHGVRGWLRASYEFDWDAAEKELGTALALNPRDLNILDLGVRLSSYLGRQQQSRQFAERALSIDPVDPGLNQGMAYARYFAGDLAGAELFIRKSVEISPTYSSGHFILGLILLARGQHAAALAEMQAEAPDGGKDAGLAIVYHAMGREADSKAALVRLTHDQDLWPYGVAQALAYRGERDRAFEWLDRAFAARDPDMNLLRVDPLLKQLRNEPRYTALLRKMNLPE